MSAAAKTRVHTASVISKHKFSVKIEGNCVSKNLDESCTNQQPSHRGGAVDSTNFGVIEMAVGLPVAPGTPLGESLGHVGLWP